MWAKFSGEAWAPGLGGALSLSLHSLKEPELRADLWFTASQQRVYSWHIAASQTTWFLPETLIVCCWARSVIYILTSQQVAVQIYSKCWTLGRIAHSVDITLPFSWLCFTAACLVRNQRSQIHVIFFICGSQDTNLLAVKDFVWCDRLIIRCLIHAQVINKHQWERNF